MADVVESPLPCPFCGGPAKTFRYNGTMQASCAGDFVDCAGFDVSAPIAMWNRRARLSQAGAGGVVEPWAIARKVVAEALDQGGSTEAATLVLEGKCDGWADVILAHRAIIAALAASPSAGEAERTLTPKQRVMAELDRRAAARAAPPAPSGEVLRIALERLRDDCQSTIDLYHRNGPSFTSPGGDEYEPTSFVIEKMEELIAVAEAALNPAPGHGEGGL